MKNQKQQPIGRGSATERDPNTAEKFKFWLRPGQMVNPFDIVAAEHFDGSMTYGLVTNIQHITDAGGHLANFISNDFGEEVEAEPQTPRQGANIAEAAVLSNSADIYMPVQNEARVYFADEDKIHEALGIDGIPKERRVPAGLIQMSNGTQAVAYLDRDFVLGPEAGHVNISGISGLATKTSYAMFLIQSILQTGPAEEIAVILLNVKYDDLLRIHEPRDLTEEERALWEQLGLRPEPWPQDRVHYLLPWGKQTRVTGRPNTFADPPPPHKVYAYALRESASKLDLLFSDIPDSSGTLASIIGEIMSGITGNEAAWRAVQTWDDLLTKPPLVQQGIPQKFRNIHASSVGRFLRLLRRIVKNPANWHLRASTFHPYDNDRAGNQQHPRRSYLCGGHRPAGPGGTDPRLWGCFAHGLRSLFRGNLAL